jgi:glycosyltransferase involved in cell wall biosynthesis
LNTGHSKSFALLHQLPEPSFPELSGWPWTEEVDKAIYNENKQYPKISIVTPSYNQGQYIEETIRSVLLQNYPNLEYIIIDGGSTDNTVEIIKKYEKWITYWVTEKDKGQSNAINKALPLMTGEIFAWINSDDYYLPKALFAVSLGFDTNKTSLILGDVINFDDVSRKETNTLQHNINLYNFITGANGLSWHQPGVFVPMDIHQSASPLDESLRYTFDTDWFAKMIAKHPIHYLHTFLAKFRLHNESKTVKENIHWTEELKEVSKRYAEAAGVSEEYIDARWDIYNMRCQILVGNISGISYRNLFKYILKYPKLLSLPITKSLIYRIVKK